MTTSSDSVVKDTAPAIVRIPRAPELPVAAVDTNDLRQERIIGFAAHDIRARPFNLLRSQVVKQLAARGQNILGITSAAPAAGKSFVSLNLAAALCLRRDRPVYLFDFDLRRGSIGRALDIEGAGLGNYLTGVTDDLASIGQRIGGEHGFALFPAFSDPDIGIDLFSSVRFEALIAGMRRLPREAIIICDLPPVFANDDAATILQQLDAYLLIVEQGETNKQQVLGAMEMLQPAPCIGTVFNRYEGGWSDPYGYGGGGKYAGYYSN